MTNVHHCECCKANSPRSHLKTITPYRTQFGFKQSLANLVPPVLYRLTSQTFQRRASYLQAISEHFKKRTWKRCTQCGLVFIAPIFSAKELASIYESIYWGRLSPSIRAHYFSSSQPAKRTLSQFAFLKKHINIPQETFLDFGAGDCNAAKYAKNLGCKEVFVYDKSMFTREIAARYNLKFTENFDETPSFDLVFASHALEHVASISNTLQQVRNKMKRNAKFFVEVPNIKNDDEVIEGTHGLHTYCFNTEGFINTFRRFGMEVYKDGIDDKGSVIRAIFVAK